MPSDLATHLRRKYGLTKAPSDDEIDAIIHDSGLEIAEREMAGRLRELICRDILFVRADQSRYWKRWVKLHGLAHWLLHDGNQAYLDSHALDGTVLSKQERQAEIFAGCMVLGGSLPDSWDNSLYSMAEDAEVPEVCLRRWWFHVLDGVGQAQVWVAQLLIRGPDN